MRVLLTHNNFNTTGGAEVFYHEVGRVLQKNGHQVAFFSVADENCDSIWSEYFPETPNYQDTGIINKTKAFASLIYSKKAKKSMARLIADYKPDIIHAFAIYVKLTPSVLDAAREADIPVVMSCNDYKHICPNYKLYHHGNVCEECRGGRFYKAALNRCCHNSLPISFASSIEAYAHDIMDIYRKNVHTFLFSSEFMAHKTEEFWGKDSFKWRKLRNPFDSTKYKLTYNPNGSVLFFGRLIEEKGVDILIHAAAKLPSVSFRIVGDGPDMQNLRKLTRELKIANVKFTGAKWGYEMDAEIESCRFVVVPSIWHENFPYVINQSFAFGKPVIGSNRGGIPELVQDGQRGLIYEATDSDALAQAINKLWNDRKLLEIMANNTKKFSDYEFNDEKLYFTLKNIYEEVVS